MVGDRGTDEASSGDRALDAEGKRSGATLAGIPGLVLTLLLKAVSFIIARPGERAVPGTSRQTDRAHREGEARMVQGHGRGEASGGDRAPGDEEKHGDAVLAGIPGYTTGLALALLLTAASFLVANSTGIVWGPGLPVVLVVLAIAQMGVHIVFFMHITTGPDSLNNAMALAFGVLIVLLLMSGTLWIMYHLNLNMMDMHAPMHTHS